jgi:hypothetical protein
MSQTPRCPLSVWSSFMQKQLNLNLQYVGIVTIASNSGSARIYEFEWIRSKAKFMQCRMLYFTVQTASAGLSRHERNWTKYLVLINLKYTLLSEHMCYMFIVHACAVYRYTVCTTEIWLLLLFHLCRQEYSLQSFTMVATLIGVAAFLFL